MAKEANKTKMEDKEFNKKIRDLKIELLKQPQKRKNIKREIARILTKKSSPNSDKNNPEDKK
jgi:ribosomal protein L29